MDILDQCGKRVRLTMYPPKRVISTVPSQTELLFDLGASEILVGRTRFCIHPKDKVNPIAKVGGTKDLKMQKIRDLLPDIIIGNKEENEKAQIQHLEQNFPVWLSDIRSLGAELDMIYKLGHIVDKVQAAEALIEFKKDFWASLPALFKPFRGARVLYLIWNNPIMGVGKDTYIDYMLEACSFTNALKDYERYPVLNIEDIRLLKPDFLFLSSEPFPFGQKHLDSFQPLFPESHILLVDGEFFSWYGSRQLHMQHYPQIMLDQLNQIK